MSDPYTKDEMLLSCKRWFEEYCSQMELCDRLGFAEHPMLTAIRLVLEKYGIEDRPPRLQTRYFVAEKIQGTVRWVSDLSESLPLVSDREKALVARVKELEDKLSRLTENP